MGRILSLSVMQVRILTRQKRLYDELKFAGLNPWLDDESLRAGEKWKMAIEETIKNRGFLSYCFLQIYKIERIPSYKKRYNSR
jgi:hypothetical protein